MLFPRVSRVRVRWVGVTGLVFTLVGCVNRGMHAPEDGGASDRTSNDGAHGDGTVTVTDGAAADRTGTDALADKGGGAGGANVDAASDTRGIGGSGAGSGGRGAGGTTGTGAGGTAGGGAGGSIMDAGSLDVRRACSARFNFDGGNRYGAFINSGFQTAFSNLSSSSDAACGSGSLRLDTTVTPTADKGEVIIPLGATEDVSGRTFSITVKLTPTATPNPYVIAFLVPSYAFVTVFSPIPSVWTTSTVTLPSGSDAGTRATTGIAVQLLGRGDSYAGAFYLDEIDLR